MKFKGLVITAAATLLLAGCQSTSHAPLQVASQGKLEAAGFQAVDAGSQSTDDNLGRAAFVCPAARCGNDVTVVYVQADPSKAPEGVNGSIEDVLRSEGRSQAELRVTIQKALNQHFAADENVDYVELLQTRLIRNAARVEFQVRIVNKNRHVVYAVYNGHFAQNSFKGTGVVSASHATALRYAHLAGVE